MAGQHCHDLRSNGDVITIFSWHSVCLSAKSVYYVSQLTVVHIHASLPCDLSRVNVQCVALEDIFLELTADDQAAKKVITGTPSSPTENADDTDTDTTESDTEKGDNENAVHM